MGSVIKALFLIFKPLETWERILQDQRSVVYLLFRYLLPMMVLAAGAEVFGLIVWGQKQAGMHRIHKFTMNEAVTYEAVRSLVLVVVVVICALLIKMFGETFRRRHTWRQTFTLVIFGLSPIFLLRLVDAAPGINPCITWAIGMMLCLEVIYQGLPRVMEPDPPNAIGLFFMSALMLVAVTGLERFMTYWYLSGHIRPMGTAVACVVAKLSL